MLAGVLSRIAYINDSGLSFKLARRSAVHLVLCRRRRLSAFISLVLI